MSEDNIECESFTVNSIDFLLLYKNKYYLQVHLDNCVYKNVKKKKKKNYRWSWWQYFLILDIINAALQ